MKNKPAEYWLRGPLPKVSPLLQPVAHALLQANDEIKESISGFPEEKLWLQPAGVASAGFHLQHITGVLDRLFTYSRNEALTRAQLDYLQQEGTATTVPPEELMALLAQQVHASISYLETVDNSLLTEERLVGRSRVPSTLIGLLFHAAEHTMRHTGQLLVTIKMLEQLT